ncbi:T9SS type A sorting domain-containing protein [Hymenobacter fodinae]|uniref:T9SS type A sorting domain-containing protein n=1 Tax=Hymenobacter fodinae TaxID=2510796 RepID=A0A4Z0PCV1_9BACT|nr:T9SS type A sorting domain-containing protein [Hymenobacter fodinae]TGE10437.1 T9SS type A sorting domain-containing protein [Hymenobacter fodinae]
MLKTLLLPFSVFLVLLLGTWNATAQPTWQRLYGTAEHESCSRLLKLKDGGYLLIGNHQAKNGYNTELYLIRTDERGNQLWTKRHPISDCTQLSSVAACENAAGQVLLSMLTGQDVINRPFTSTGLLLMLKTDGAIAWQQRTEPETGEALPYSGIALDKTGNFWIATNRPTGSALLRLTATGEQLQQVPFAIPSGTLPAPAPPSIPAGPTFIYNLFQLPTGLFAYAGSRAGTKLIALSDQGTQGRETALPSWAYQTQGNTYVSNVVSLGGDDVLVVSNGQLDKLQLNSSTIYWSRAYSKSTLLLQPSQAASLPDGRILVLGATGGSHVYSLLLTVLDATGAQLYAESAGLPGAQQPVQYELGKSLSAVGAGLFVDPQTKQVVVCGSLRGDNPAEEIFLSAGPLESLRTATLQPLTAWPNPVTSTETLTIPADFAQNGQFELYSMQGSLVHRWPDATDEGEAHLSMQGIPAGMYLLTGKQANGARSTMRVIKN